MKATPLSKINTKRWSGFVQHIRDEADFMKSVRENATETRKSSNSSFSELSKRTSKSIFMTFRKDPRYYTVARVDSVPHIERKAPSSRTMPQNDKIIYMDAHPQNMYSWPKRKSSAMRVLHPEKLDNYPKIQRNKDIEVVSGATLDEDMLLTI